MSLKNTPLWPAGHLPHKGGDRMAAMSRLQDELSIAEMASETVDIVGGRRALPISPLVGEMPGRAEGGITGNRPTMLQEERP